MYGQSACVGETGVCSRMYQNFYGFWLLLEAGQEQGCFPSGVGPVDHARLVVVLQHLPKMENADMQVMTKKKSCSLGTSQGTERRKIMKEVLITFHYKKHSCFECCINECILHIHIWEQLKGHPPQKIMTKHIFMSTLDCKRTVLLNQSTC